MRSPALSDTARPRPATIWVYAARLLRDVSTGGLEQSPKLLVQKLMLRSRSCSALAPTVRIVTGETYAFTRASVLARRRLSCDRYVPRASAVSSGGFSKPPSV